MVEVYLISGRVLQLAERGHLKCLKCRFESDRAYQLNKSVGSNPVPVRLRVRLPNKLTVITLCKETQIMFLKLTSANSGKPCFVRSDKIISIERDKGYIKNNFEEEQEYTLIVAEHLA